MAEVVGVATVASDGRSPASRRWKTERWFFSGLAVVAALTTFVGFSRSYYLKAFFGTPALPPLVHLHGALFSAWIALLVTQTSLVAAGKTPIHRRLGVAGGALAASMTVLGFLVAIGGARRGVTVPGVSPLAFLTVPLGTIVVFPALVGAALAMRRRPDVHKRLMVLATVELLVAAVARIPGLETYGIPVFFGLADLVILAMGVYDLLTRGQVHSATLWGGLFLVSSQWLRLAIANTGVWLATAAWLTR